VRRTVPEPAAAHEYRDVSTAGVYRTGAVRPHPRWNWTGTGAWDWLWSLIKLAIVGLLALLVLGALVRACSSPPLVVGVGDQHEEQRLRAEIASLRAQIGQIARSCPASADRSAAGAGAMSLPARSNVTLAAMPSIAPPPCADRIRDDNA
jgi:hypothetical protein